MLSKKFKYKTFFYSESVSIQKSLDYVEKFTKMITKILNKFILHTVVCCSKKSALAERKQVCVTKIENIYEQTLCLG